MKEILIDFWKETIQYDSPCYLHNEDKSSLNNYFRDKKQGKEYLLNDLVPDPNNPESLLKIEANPTAFRNYSIPVPYVGDIENAKVFYLTGNPGYMHGDYFHTQNSKDLVQDLKNNIKQGESLDKEYPFMFLNPKYYFTGGYEYWIKKTRNIENALVKSYQGKDEIQKILKARQAIAKNFAVLELTGYPSASMNQSAINQLVSKEIIVNFVKKVLIPLVKDDKVIIICARSLKLWDLEDEVKKKTRGLVYLNNRGGSISDSKLIELVKVGLIDKLNSQ